MDAFAVTKQESNNKESSDASVSEAAATLQQMLATSGALMSPLQFLPAATDGTNTAAALPWMLPSAYQMMVVPQSFLPAQGGTTSVPDGHIVIAPSAVATLADGSKADRVAAAGGQSVAAILKRAKDATGNSVSPRPELMGQYLNDGLATESPAKPDIDSLKPPKKPLTPYMTFSKMIWPQVKAANPHLSSVTEIGAVVGAMWRDLDPVEKQRYNDQFNKDKIAYSEELHTYLKTTGLHASDLVKPKPKRNARDRSSAAPSASQLNHPQHQHLVAAGQQHLLAAGQAAAAGSALPAASAASTLTTAGQQLIQTLLGLQPGLATSAAAAAGDATAALAQAWAGQPVQQVLAQMGLSGQTLFANSDGTISVDGSLLTIQGQPVQLAGHVAPSAFGDQATSSTATAGTDAAVADADPSRSWAWHQPSAGQSDGTATPGGGAPGGMVVYQLPAGTTSDSGPATTSGTDGQPATYYSVDAFGQLVKQESTSAATPATASSVREGQLELEVLQLQTALEEKAREVDSLRAQLSEAYATVERLKSANAEPSLVPSTTSNSSGAGATGDQTTASSDFVLAAGDVAAAPSPPS